MEDGKLQITVNVTPPRWARWVGKSDRIEKTYRLDVYGKQVYQACNGKTAVKHIIRKFASKHQISLSEAELSVTRFLKTLTAKGLVAMTYEMKKRNEQAANRSTV